MTSPNQASTRLVRLPSTPNLLRPPIPLHHKLQPHQLMRHVKFQCRSKTTRPKMICDQSKDPYCTVRICNSCLIVKPVYDHIPELRPPIFQFVPGGRMLCVKCRPICPCISCRRRRGEEEQCLRGRVSSRLEKECRPPAEKKTPATAIRREVASTRNAGDHGKHDRLHHGAAPPAFLPLPTHNSHTTAPSRSLPSIKHPKAKQARPSNDSGASGSNSLLNSSNIHLLAELLTARNSSNPVIRKEPTESQLSSPPNESHIQGYLDFLGVRNKTRTLEVLEANGFHSHKIFNSPGLSENLM
ncbi:hypothetical protein PCASD_18108 [Puccinia coronata f. sp. avenae]|uniref:Zinc-finger domain-containing protein n=1 Tax=Puccinia coronata f. sp. avenae TaxID=200324 RepID=A0A2N5SSL8_9BASI|nr:hypothetical protein PCASD_18108 [Puccinia coronata f. sp. avenae]